MTSDRASARPDRCASSAADCSVPASASPCVEKGVDVILDDASPVNAAPRDRLRRRPCGRDRRRPGAHRRLRAARCHRPRRRRRARHLPGRPRDRCRERQSRASRRAARPRRRPQPIHRHAPDGRPGTRRPDLCPRRPVHRSPVGASPGTTASRYRRAGAIEDLVLDLGAVPIEMIRGGARRAASRSSPTCRRWSSSLLAARLRDGHERRGRARRPGPARHTRIASSDPELWVQILGANAAPVVDVLRATATTSTP